MKTLISVAILLLCTIPLSSSMSDDDKQIIRTTVLFTLSEEDEFKYTDSEVDWNNALNVWYITEKTDEDTTLLSLAKIVGVYWGVVQDHPDISDLNIMVGTKEYVGGKAYCKRAWMDELKPGPDGKLDALEGGLLVLRVLGTFEKTI